MKRKTPPNILSTVKQKRTLSLLLLIYSSLLIGCSAERPFVLTQPNQLADLYWDGELRDTKGNQWNITILPGIHPMYVWSRESFEDCGQMLKNYGEKEFWKDCGDWVEDSLEFSEDCLIEYGLEGISDDFSEASTNISENFQKTPFGWIPRIIGNTFWGYLIKPSFRLVTAPVGAVMGLCGTVIMPTGQALAPVTFALGNSTFNGILIPISGITAHQLIYLLVLPNREPTEDLDGHFGLYIIKNDEESVKITEEERFSSPELKQEELKQILVQFIQLQKVATEYQLKLEALEKAESQKIQQEEKVEEHRYYEPATLSSKAASYKKNQLRKDFTKLWAQMKQEISPERQKYLILEEEGFRLFLQLLGIFEEEE